MADNGNTGSGNQGQESGTETPGQSQVEAPQQNGSQSQEDGSQGLADISKMSETELRTYAAKVQKDAEEARREAAKHRTSAQSLQQKVTEAERAKMSEQEKLQADLDAATAERDELKRQVADYTVGTAVRDALDKSGAINAATAQKVMGMVELDENGKPRDAALKAAIAELKKTDPYLFKRGGSADAGAGGNGGAPEGDNSVNDFIRGRTGR
jgi:hypothetical protein